ncbi:MAG TPA: hypothetical protein VGP26_25075 [Actinophytocola sp.]|jgi:hypothetical protein|nr:hypothetical protein [Actinophytocola sp.]
MTAQLASVDLRQDEYIVSTYSKTAKGLWVLDGTPTRLPQGSAADELGMAVLEALARARAGLDDPTRDSEPARPLLDLLGLPDFATYAKGTRSVEVYRDGETVEVTPKRNTGGRAGFTPIDDGMETFAYDSPKQLGAAVVNAFVKAV